MNGPKLSLSGYLKDAEFANAAESDERDQSFLYSLFCSYHLSLFSPFKRE